MTYELQHYWLCPQSRVVRLALGECKISFKSAIFNPWKDWQHLLPVITLDKKHKIQGAYAILEYLNEMLADINLLGEEALERAYVRELCTMIAMRLDRSVINVLLNEKLYKKHLRHGQPIPANIRQANKALAAFLPPMAGLLQQRHWLAGPALSYADLTLGGYVSIIDYLGEFDWVAFPEIKEWYTRLKCRPSFRPLLQDVVPGLIMPTHYRDLDF